MDTQVVGLFQAWQDNKMLHIMGDDELRCTMYIALEHSCM